MPAMPERPLRQRNERLPRDYASPLLPKLERIAAFVENFPTGPVLRPTMITSLDDLARIFGQHAPQSNAAHGLRLWFGAGGQQALVIRSGGHAPARGSDFVLGLNVLSMAAEPWHFLCLTTLSRLDDYEFRIVASHARDVCGKLGTYAEIYDPRNLLVDVDR